VKFNYTGKFIIKKIKLPLFFIGDKKHPPLKFPHQKSQYFKLWCKANNLQKKYSILLAQAKIP